MSDVFFHRFAELVAACREYTRELFVHHFRVESAEQLNEELGRWIGDAYDEVGCGSRLARG